MPEDTGSTDLYLTDVSPTDKPWDKHRAIAATIEELYEQTELKRYAERISQCSRQLCFALAMQEEGNYKLKLHSAHFCRVRHCAVCQWRRMLMWRARFFQVLPKLLETYPTSRWVFLTLTVRNCPLDELKTTLQAMNKAWVRLTQRKQFPALGWVKSVEVTREHATDYAHPHFHCLLLVPASYFSHGYIKQADWVKLWREALRAEYDPSVRVQAIKPKGKPTGDEATDAENAMRRAILETFKYSIKPEDLIGSNSLQSGMTNAAWLEELTRQLHKTRAIAVGGVLRQFISEEEPEDLVHAEGEEVELSEDELQVWFGWREMVQRYAKEER